MDLLKQRDENYDFLMTLRTKALYSDQTPESFAVEILSYFKTTKMPIDIISIITDFGFNVYTSVFKDKCCVANLIKSNLITSQINTKGVITVNLEFNKFARYGIAHLLGDILYNIDYDNNEFNTSVTDTLVYDNSTRFAKKLLIPDRDLTLDVEQDIEKYSTAYNVPISLLKLSN